MEEWGSYHHYSRAHLATVTQQVELNTWSVQGMVLSPEDEMVGQGERQGVCKCTESILGGLGVE